MRSAEVDPSIRIWSVYFLTEVKGSSVWGKVTFSSNGVGAIEQPCAKEMNLDPYLTPYMKIY